jgi:hypothetical protein
MGYILNLLLNPATGVEILLYLARVLTFCHAC